MMPGGGVTAVPELGSRERPGESMSSLSMKQCAPFSFSSPSGSALARWAPTPAGTRARATIVAVTTARPCTARRMRMVMGRSSPRPARAPGGAYRPSPPRGDGVLRLPVLLGGTRAVERPFLRLGQHGVGQGLGVVDARLPLLGRELPGPLGDEVGRRG